ncbi:tRNA (guanine-N(7)-)-methyltransferase non-catalytic subunit wdr4 [Chanos chanos]|uniref:tRNA (Guanine-N(7)-)-methyltransferase non-catalytic subunit wdr4 n=1 Tax=Chanos chanos TaxID=29144 RepID=A0A6J2WHA1_CHACN|nr:tRNA (guanine-N(7)-)-methyltransferase non-catalytic subunit WDR4 [Chanos chanos]
MAVVCNAGEWLVTSCGKYLIAVHINDTREPFVFDCSKAEQRPKENDFDCFSDGAGSDEKGSDKVLAFAVSPSGKQAALTDDNKRLILFQLEPTWHCVSTRWVVRRCTSLVFTQTEEEVLVADKSGDVYSFSCAEPQKQGELKLGHLSMLLALTVSPDDKYIITADRDEKIRVSSLRSPYNIQSFCLGHREFVSTLLVPCGHPDWLLSGSGDGTVKLWNYDTGRRLQSFDMRQLTDTQTSDTDTEKKFAISRIACSPDGRHVAVQCERIPSVQLFVVEAGAEGRLEPSERLDLPHAPWDMTFDSHGRLWVLLENEDTNVLLYTHSQDHWQSDAESLELKRVSEALKAQWNSFQDSVGEESKFQHLYKVNFDNMASYLQKKQERLKQQEQKEGKKRAAENSPQSNGARKKSKAKGKNGAVAQS